MSFQVSRADNSEPSIPAPQAERSTNHLPSDSTAVKPTQSTPLTAEETPPHGPIEVTPRSIYYEAPTAPTNLSVEGSTTFLLPQQESTNHPPSASTATQPTPLTAKETPPRGPSEVTPRCTYQEAPTAPAKLSVEDSTTLLLPHQVSGPTALETFESQALRTRPDGTSRSLTRRSRGRGLGNNPNDSFFTFDTAFTSWEQSRAALVALGVPHDELGRWYELYLWDDI